MVSIFMAVGSTSATCCCPFLEIACSETQVRGPSHGRIAPTATVQLLHQSVKDFFANAQGADFLYFTEAEASSTLMTIGRRYVQLQRRTFESDVVLVIEKTLRQAKEDNEFLRDQCLLRYLLCLETHQDMELVEDLKYSPSM